MRASRGARGSDSKRRQGGAAPPAVRGGMDFPRQRSGPGARRARAHHLAPARGPDRCRDLPLLADAAAVRVGHPLVGGAGAHVRAAASPAPRTYPAAQSRRRRDPHRRRRFRAAAGRRPVARRRRRGRQPRRSGAREVERVDLRSAVAGRRDGLARRSRSAVPVRRAHRRRARPASLDAARRDIVKRSVGIVGALSRESSNSSSSSSACSICCATPSVSRRPCAACCRCPSVRATC